MRHILIHTEVPCYHCTLCGDTFRNRCAGDGHNKANHDNKAIISLMKNDFVNGLYEKHVRAISGTDKGNVKRMRGGNLEAAFKLAEAVKMETPSLNATLEKRNTRRGRP